MMKSLYNYVVTESDLKVFKEHTKKMKHAIGNPYQYGVAELKANKAGLRSFLFGTSYSRDFSGFEFKELPLGVEIKQFADYWTKQGIEDYVDVCGVYAEEFMVMTDTCKYGDVVYCSCLLKRFIDSVLNPVKVG